MKYLVESQSGYALYSELCTSLGSSVVDLLIEHNIVHLRPAGMCSYDFPLEMMIALMRPPLYTTRDVPTVVGSGQH